MRSIRSAIVAAWPEEYRGQHVAKLCVRLTSSSGRRLEYVRGCPSPFRSIRGYLYCRRIALRSVVQMHLQAMMDDADVLVRLAGAPATVFCWNWMDAVHVERTFGLFMGLAPKHWDMLGPDYHGGLDCWRRFVCSRSLRKTRTWFDDSRRESQSRVMA